MKKRRFPKQQIRQISDMSIGHIPHAKNQCFSPIDGASCYPFAGTPCSVIVAGGGSIC